MLGLWCWSGGSLASAPTGTYADSRLLLEQAGQWLDPEQPVRLTLKTSGSYRPLQEDGALLRDGQELSRLLDMPAAETEAQAGVHGERVYRQEQPLPGGCGRTLLLAEIDPGQSYLIVKVECTLSLRKAGEALAYQRELDERLAAASFVGRWNVIVQGGLAAAETRDAEAVLADVRGAFDAQEAERYADGGTVSVSYTSPRLREFVVSGTNRLHLQVALHRDSVTGSRRLTLGTPVITTEY